MSRAIRRDGDRGELEHFCQPTEGKSIRLQSKSVVHVGPESHIFKFKKSQKFIFQHNISYFFNVGNLKNNFLCILYRAPVSNLSPARTLTPDDQMQSCLWQTQHYLQYCDFQQHHFSQSLLFQLFSLQKVMLPICK